MLRLTLLLSLLLAATAAALPAPPPDSTPEVLLAYIRADEALTRRPLDDDARFGFPDPRAVFRSRGGVAEPWPDVVARLGRDLHLPADAADPLAHALVRWFAFTYDFERAPLDVIEADFEHSIRASGGAFEAVSCAGLFFHYGRRSDWQRGRFLALIERVAADVPGLPMVIARLPGAHTEELLFAFEKAPSTLMPILERVGDWSDPALLPIYDAGLAKLLPHVTPESAPLVTRVAVAKLSALLHAGLASDAVAFFESLPHPIRNTILTTAVPTAIKHGSWWHWTSDPLEDLSAAFLLMGNRAMAESIVSRRPPKHLPPLLEAALSPARDPFEVLVQRGPTHGVWGALSLHLAAAYPTLRRKLLAELSQDARPLSRDVAPLERTTRALAPINARNEAMRAAWALELAALKTPAVIEEADSIAPTIARLLAASLRPACVEQPGPADAAAEESEPVLFAEPTEGSMVAWVRHAKEIFAILRMAPDEDPAGESTRSHWLTRSSDGGKTWTPRRYLGLRFQRPYSLPPWRRPSIVDGRLVLTVDARPNIVESVPIAKRRYRLQVVACDLAELDRDTDGDGLTDLLEGRLVTDPESRDTDVDGLDDTTDPLPHVPLKGTPTVAATLQIRLHVESTPYFGTLFDKPEAWRVDGRSATHIVVADRRALGGFAPAVRVVVLTADEARRLREKFDGFMSTSLPVVELNHAETMALVTWSSTIGGHPRLLRKEQDGWHVESLRNR